MALRIGALLRAARVECPETFTAWVEFDLPFGLDTARRLMAISEAYEKLPAEMLEQLPRPWQALYALRVLPPDEMRALTEAGVITPDMTTEQARQAARRWKTGTGAALTSNSRHHRADIAAGALMEFAPHDLNVHVLRSLRKWLARSD
jgi:hypothetical protein